LDDDDPFFLVKKACSFLPHGCCTLSHKYIYSGFSTGNKVHKYYFGEWSLVGVRMCFVEPNKQDGWLSLRWFWTTNLSTRTRSWMSNLPVHSCLLCCFVTVFSTGLHLPNVLVHSCACIIDPSTWWFCFESPPCSLASHASMIFLQNKALAAPMLVLCMWFDKRCWRGIPWCIVVRAWLG
jgi:hypothetical protein